MLISAGRKIYVFITFLMTLSHFDLLCKIGCGFFGERTQT